MDGRYAITFATGSYTGQGEGRIDVQQFVSTCGCYRLSGEILSHENRLATVMVVLFDSSTVKPTHCASDFTMLMTGHMTSSGFSLIGTGPLGAIVEISGQRRDDP